MPSHDFTSPMETRPNAVKRLDYIDGQFEPKEISRICFANSEIIGDLETTFDGSITILFRKVENTILIDLRNDRFSDLFILHSEYTKFKNILKSKVFNLIH